MPLPQHEDYTTEDIYHLPEGTRAELIDGQIYYMAPPTRTHQKLLFSISRTIADYIDSKKGICEVDIAPFAVFLNEDNRNYVCLLYTSPSPRDKRQSRMPSSA